VENKIYIVGIGDDQLDGLGPMAAQIVAAADMIIGDPRALEGVNAAVNPSAERVQYMGDLDAVVEKLNGRGEKMAVILAVGDPLFYGTARYLCDAVGKDHFEVLPHVSSMQLAFARVKESWDDAYLANTATQPLERLIGKIRTAERVGLFTSDEIPPNLVAQSLADERIEYFTIYVCENLGSRDERVTVGSVKEIASQTFSPLNVMVLVRELAVPDKKLDGKSHRLFGNPDEHFRQSRPKRGLLTPSEIRCLVLSEMDLSADSVVWDVGAGSGSVAIEAAQIARDGTTFAIEMDAEDFALISENAEQFGVKNLKPVLGQAPAVWEDLPDPDAVFVGGSGRQISALVDAAIDRLKPGGSLVCVVGTIENVQAVFEIINTKLGDADAWMMNVARGIQQLQRLRFESLNPTFVLSGHRKA
jgi:precorrin-6Y C5,15-methyltransferase (decarboxylating)